jgi:hypothetical protein
LAAIASVAGRRLVSEYVLQNGEPAMESSTRRLTVLAPLTGVALCVAGSFASAGIMAPAPALAGGKPAVTPPDATPKGKPQAPAVAKPAAPTLGGTRPVSAAEVVGRVGKCQDWGCEFKVEDSKHPKVEKGAAIEIVFEGPVTKATLKESDRLYVKLKDQVDSKTTWRAAAVSKD